MTDAQKTEDGGNAEDQSGTTSTATDDKTDPEKGFWERFDKTVEGAVDRVVEKRLKGLRGDGTGTGTSRGTSRGHTLPEIIADFMFGKDK